MPLRMWEEYSNEEEAERMFAGGGADIVNY